MRMNEAPRLFSFCAKVTSHRSYPALLLCQKEAHTRTNLQAEKNDRGAETRTNFKFGLGRGCRRGVRHPASTVASEKDGREDGAAILHGLMSWVVGASTAHGRGLFAIRSILQAEVVMKWSPEQLPTSVDGEQGPSLEVQLLQLQERSAVSWVEHAFTTYVSLEDALSCTTFALCGN
jgi:hypothetical protein